MTKMAEWIPFTDKKGIPGAEPRAGQNLTACIFSVNMRKSVRVVRGFPNIVSKIYFVAAADFLKRNSGDK